MFAQDSERGRVGGPSWESGWNSYGSGSSHNYGHNSNVEGQEDFRNQGFGARSYEQEVSRNSSDTVCQNYLRNKCNRGNNCLFQHPPLSGSNPRPAATLNSKKLQNAWLNFCPDFQRGQCPYSDDCRLLHVSKQDEVEYRTSGDIPTGVVEQAMSKAMVMDWAYIGNQPHCKNYLQGSCNLRDCRLRHLNTDQYVVEVLQALREKFEMNSNAMFQNPPVESGHSMGTQKSSQYEAPRAHGMNTQGADQYGNRRGPNRAMDNQETNQYGMRRAPGPPVGNPEADQYGARRAPVHSRDNFEPETKRMRGQDSNYQTDSRGESRRGNNRDDSFVRSQPSDENFLEKLRRDSIDLTITNENVKRSARKLEEENTELRKALRLALDLNAYARNLPEFRNQLRDIMSSLRKRGFHPTAQPDARSWNSMPGKSMNPSREDWMHGSRYSSSDMSSKGSRHSLGEYGRGDMQRVDTSRFKSSW